MQGGCALNYWLDISVWYNQLFIVLVAVYCSYATIRLSLLFISVKHWVHVSANISSVISSPQESESGLKYEGFNLEYSYRFNGKEYKSNKVSLSSFIFGLSLVNNKQLLEKLKRCFRTASPIFVWVNPNKPSEAVLDNAIEIKYLLFCVVTLAFFVYLLLKANA